MGLWQLYCENMRDKMKDKSSKFIDEINDSYREAFEFMVECVGITDLLDPLTQEKLEDPTSPELCLILYLHSIEPPFYAYLNDAS